MSAASSSTSAARAMALKPQTTTWPVIVVGINPASSMRFTSMTASLTAVRSNPRVPRVNRMKTPVKTRPAVVTG